MKICALRDDVPTPGTTPADVFHQDWLKMQRFFMFVPYKYLNTLDT